MTFVGHAQTDRASDLISPDRTPTIPSRPSRQWPQPAPPHDHSINVGRSERRISMIAGGALALFGLSRRSLAGMALAGLGGALLHRGVTGHCYAYDALGIDTAERDFGRPEQYFEQSIHVRQSVTINKSPEELFRYWRDLSNFPRIMTHVKSIQVLDDRRSHWTVTGPLGTSLEWDAEIINEEPNQLIAWRSLGGAQVDNAGSVRFLAAPGDRGTEVKVVLDYIPPAGKLGGWIASVFGEDPVQQIHEDLRRFKCLMETGEVLSRDDQTRGTCTRG